MPTDTTERGLERIICTALAGHPCDPPPGPTVGEPPVPYAGAGWSGGNFHDYDREYCVDLAQLSAFLRATQPEAAESLGLSEAGPTRRRFLARLQVEISKRGTIDVLRRLLADAAARGVGGRYLVQHSAGSGKSNSTARSAITCGSARAATGPSSLSLADMSSAGRRSAKRR